MLISFHTQIININPTCGVYAGGGVSGPWIEEVDHYSQTEQEKNGFKWPTGRAIVKFLAT